jgi:hypothetical protein
MIKMKLEWEHNGKKFEEWTLPWDIAEAEAITETQVVERLGKRLPPTLAQLFHIAYSIQKRISDKPVGKFEDWRTGVVHITSNSYDATNFTQPEVSQES